MKNILLLGLITLFGCNNNYTIVDTTILKGVISAKEEGYQGRFPRYPKIYIQNNKSTVGLNIPFYSECYFKVGDSCILVIQQVEKAVNIDK